PDFDTLSLHDALPISLIRASNFYEAKVPNLLALARRVQEEYDGTLPCDEQVLLSFKGVGPKCAHLVMAIACGQPSIAVDVHVHRDRKSTRLNSSHLVI